MKEHVLIAETMWGPMLEETAKEHMKTRIFPCGHCSDSEIQVYHNILGRHLHQNPEVTKAKLAEHQ